MEVNWLTIWFLVGRITNEQELAIHVDGNPGEGDWAGRLKRGKRAKKQSKHLEAYLFCGRPKKGTAHVLRCTCTRLRNSGLRLGVAGSFCYPRGAS